jgi:hypothetical protein
MSAWVACSKERASKAQHFRAATTCAVTVVWCACRLCRIEVARVNRKAPLAGCVSLHCYTIITERRHTIIKEHCYSITEYYCHTMGHQQLVHGPRCNFSLCTLTRWASGACPVSLCHALAEEYAIHNGQMPCRIHRWVPWGHRSCCWHLPAIPTLRSSSAPIATVCQSANHTLEMLCSFTSS